MHPVVQGGSESETNTKSPTSRKRKREKEKVNPNEGAADSLAEVRTRYI